MPTISVYKNDAVTIPSAHGWWRRASVSGFSWSYGHHYWRDRGRRLNAAHCGTYRRSISRGTQTDSKEPTHPVCGYLPTHKLYCIAQLAAGLALPVKCNVMNSTRSHKLTIIDTIIAVMHTVMVATVAAKCCCKYRGIKIYINAHFGSSVSYETRPSVPVDTDDKKHEDYTS